MDQQIHVSFSVPKLLYSGVKVVQYPAVLTLCLIYIALFFFSASHAYVREGPRTEPRGVAFDSNCYNSSYHGTPQTSRQVIDVEEPKPVPGRSIKVTEQLVVYKHDNNIIVTGYDCNNIWLPAQDASMYLLIEDYT